MDDGVDQVAEENESGVAETVLGGREFRGAVEHREPGAPELKPAPEGIPEKFWDPIEGKLRTEDLIKSYGELEKKIGGSKEEASEEEAAEETAEETEETTDETEEGSEEETSEETEEETSEETDDGVKAELSESISSAQQEYAQTGELSAETREALAEKLTAVGISPDYIDFHLQGVKAAEAALQGAAEEAAGSAEDLQAAMEWAAKAWAKTPKKAAAFNAQMGDVETIKLAVPGLMKEYRAANPGEGRLHNVNTGLTHGDVYSNMDEFDRDLDQADRLRDKIGRRNAIDKLRRSRKAGTIKSKPRQPFGG